MLELAEESFSNLCRLCGEVDNVCLDLFDDIGQGDELLTKIENSIRISILQDDGLPQSICSECHKKLLEYSTFYQQCHDTQERLKEFLCIESAIQKTNTSKQDQYDGDEIMIETYDHDGEEVYLEEVEDEHSGAAQTDEDPTIEAVKEEVFNEEGSLASNKKHVEEKTEEYSTMPLGDNLSVSQLHLYEPLTCERQLSHVGPSIENPLGLTMFDDTDRSGTSFCKEMDVLLCGKTGSQQTQPQLSCFSESQSLTSPSFSLQGEEFSLDQGSSINMNEFPLGEAPESVIEKENVDQLNFAPLATGDGVIPVSLEGLSSIEPTAPALPVSLGVPLERTAPNQSFAPQSPNQDHELESLPSIPSLHENCESDFQSMQAQGDVSTVLTVNANIIGGSGEIKFQRNMGGVKIVFPPTTVDKAIGFDDLIKLFSLSEVRETFCADNKEEEIIQQLVEQGLGSGNACPSGRASALSQTSSLDLPNSLLSPLSSVCDSWSWEISQLLGDENSNQGDDGNNRSELNTPVVTFPQNKPSDLSNLKEPSQFLLPESNVQTAAIPLSESFSLPKNFQAAETKFFPLSSSNSIPQRVFTPLQVQIPEESDTSVKLSRTLHSSNTYFEELSLGISPVLDLDPNVATVRVSFPLTENPEPTQGKKHLSFLPSLTTLDQGYKSNELANNEVSDETAEEVDSDIKEISVDIIIDDGKRNWLKLLPDPTDEFIKTVARNCFKCHICSKSFTSKVQIQRHIKINHSTDKPFICAICGATFSIKHYLSRHMKVHNPHSKLQCKLCPREFSRNYQLVEHEQSHKGPPTLKCSDCGKRFNSKNAFFAHKSFCTGNLQSYVCDICGKTYPGMTALNHHRVRHDSVKKFKCTKCESSFHTQWQLVKHEKQHSVQGTFVCKICSLAFNSTTNLKKHEAKCPALRTIISSIKN